MRGARTAGYGSARVYRLPEGTRPSAVIRFYRRPCSPTGDRSLGQRRSTSLRSGDAYLHILAGPTEVAAELDYDCYKGRPSPSYAGP
jgi:hypothetical protein